jgi:tol-pal system protein YbgF
MTGAENGRRAALRRVLGLGAGSILALTPLVSGCYAPQLAMLRGGIDSLRTQVDTLTVRDSIAYRVLEDTRRDVAGQRDVLLSTRATAGSTTQELFEQMGRLEGKLDEVMGRFNQIAQRPPPTVSVPGSTAAPAPDPGTLYDQAAQDLTQGRYGLALQGFRDFVRRFPTAELADNAQYGAGECFFAQSQFDSAATEYARVEAGWKDGDKVPAALYKLALCQERLGQNGPSKKTLEDLVKRFPLAGEAQLARERLGTKRAR